MILEICADSYDAVILAQKYKVKRVELCSALSLGGLTPSVGLIEKCVEIDEVEIHVMIRHKEGDFVYSSDDIEIMESDIIIAKEAGAKGVVFGCITTDNEIDIKQNKLLYKLSKRLGLEVTFHRAFDFCTSAHRSLEEVINIGFDRLLSSGQENTAEEGILLLNKLVNQSNGRIQIMAGSGVNSINALRIAATNVDALHFTSHLKSEESNNLGMGFNHIQDERKIKSIIELF